MSSLLTQMRAAPSELIERRHGTRKYQPDYKLTRHITIPTWKEGLDPKPPPFLMRTEGAPPHQVYTTPHGVLCNDVMGQFACHYQWKTASQLAYVRHHPTCPPFPGKGQIKFEPRPDMVRSVWAGQRAPGGPFEYQKIIGGGGNLPEAKAWPMVQKQYTPFPYNGGARADLFREVRHNIGGRTPEDTEKVRNHIRELVKDNNLNTQFVRPLTYYKGLQDEARTYEPLERPPGRNPVNMDSEYMAQFDRHLPAKQYQKPQFGAERPLSKSVVLQRPYNFFNQKEHPHSLDYLPTPCNLSTRPHDVRLIKADLE